MVTPRAPARRTSELMSEVEVRAALRRRLVAAKLSSYAIGRVRFKNDMSAEAAVLGRGGRIVLTVDLDRRTGAILWYG